MLYGMRHQRASQAMGDQQAFRIAPGGAQEGIDPGRQFRLVPVDAGKTGRAGYLVFEHGLPMMGIGAAKPRHDDHGVSDIERCHLGVPAQLGHRDDACSRA